MVTARKILLFLAAAQTQLLSVAPSGNPSFVITSPDGSRAWSVNEFNDGRIEIYARDPLTGALTLTDRCINVGAPVCVQFLTGR